MEQIVSLERIIKQTQDLPVLSANALEVFKATDSGIASAQSIAEIILRDQALTARILRLSNSAFYGSARKISHVSEAVVVLGFRTIRSLSLVAASYPWMMREYQGYRLGPMQLWTHAFATATGAKLLAQHVRGVDEETAFVSGLLHDIGKTVLSLWMKDRLEAALHLCEVESIAFDEAERRLLGYDHAMVGGALAESWNFPRDLVEVITYHHRPAEAQHNRLVDLVHVADYMAMILGYGLGGDSMAYRLDSGSFDRLGMSSGDLPRFSGEIIDGCKQFEQMFTEVVLATDATPNSSQRSYR